MRIIALILLLWVAPIPISRGCSPFIKSFRGYSFVSRDVLINAAKEVPFAFNFDFGLIYQYFGDDGTQQEQQNIKEWQERVCDYADLEDIEYIVYKASKDELGMMQAALFEKNAILPANFEGNSFVDYLIQLKCEETVAYLIFAKTCEPHVTIPEGNWEDSKRDKQAMEDLIKQGLQQFRSTKSHFIKLRYAYQIIRLAHYKGSHEEVLKLYDYLLPKTDERKSIIYYWLLGHRAGALHALGNYVEASYLYAVIFKNAPERRASAYQSFSIKTTEQWNACFNKCQDDEERNSMYAMRAIGAGSKVVEEMRNIYALNPKSEFLELLLVRSIRQLERELLGYPVGTGVRRHQRTAHKIPKDDKGIWAIALRNFAFDARKGSKVKRPDLWHIAEGYLAFLAGDYYGAEKILKQAEQTVKNKALKEQLHAISTVLELAQLDKIDAAVENRLLAMSQDKKLTQNFSDFQQFFNDKVAQLYQDNGRPGLAFRAHYGIKDLRYKPDLKIIDDLLETIGKGKSTTRFEELMGKDTLSVESKLELLHIKATYFMSKHQFKQAQAVWQSMDRAEWKRFGQFSPFIERFKDCINCKEDRLLVDTASVFNKGEIVESILKADSDARLGAPRAARKLYNIGLGLYNMSYFGHSWMVTDFFRSGASYTPYHLALADGIVPHWATPYGNQENFDVALAVEYFEEARQLAEKDGNRELAARATFMAAKCQQKMFYTSGLLRPTINNQIPKAPDEYLTYFQLLKEDYFDTDFYYQIIAECKYFQMYATK